MIKGPRTVPYKMTYDREVSESVKPTNLAPFRLLLLFFSIFLKYFYDKTQNGTRGGLRTALESIMSVSIIPVANSS